MSDKERPCMGPLVQGSYRHLCTGMAEDGRPFCKTHANNPSYWKENPPSERLLFPPQGVARPEL